MQSQGAKVTADRNLCRGYGNCVATAPDYFDLDDCGKVVVLNAEFPGKARELVERAVNSCPVNALKIIAG